MKLWVWALDLLFPPKCPFCERVLEEPRAPLCADCQPKLPWLDEKDAFRKVEFTAGCWSVLEYRDTVREAVHRYKFTPVRARGEALGKLMAQCVQDHPEVQPEIITWVPLSRKRRRKRGFDQAEELARTMGRELGLPVEGVLKKDADTRQQSSIRDKEVRRANVLGVYSLQSGAEVRGKCLLLVDDVVTSGSTLSACAKVLAEAGAEKVWCVTLAQAGN